MRWTWLAPYTGWLFLATLLFNLRAAWKLAVDWAGMLTTIRFVRAGYARRGELPAEERLRAESGAPVFLTLIAAYQFAKSRKWEFNLASIDPDYPKSSSNGFDYVYMQQLFDYGYQRGRGGRLWQWTPSEQAPLRPRVAGR